MLNEKIEEKFLEKNTLLLTGEINEKTAEEIIEKILFLQFTFEEKCVPEIDRKIVVLINSQGGSIQAGFAILDVLKATKARIITVACGMAYSMGSFLLAMGSKGCRYALENSEILLHQPLGGVQGQASDMLIRTQNIIEKKEKLNKMLALAIGQDYKKIYYDLERDFILTPKQALDYGVVDKIIDNFQEVFGDDDV